MSGSRVQELRAINHNLRLRISRLRQATQNPPALTAKDLGDVLADLIRAADHLREISRSAVDADQQQEISEYHSHVKALSEFLPSVQGRLLAEKARLDSARTHVARASAWAEASKKTL